MDYNRTQGADVCTTCFVKGDHSNYWIPHLYYQHADGSVESVDQVGSASMYYFNEPSRLGAGETVESFPNGLRMFAGDPNKRTLGTDNESKAINYKCLDYSGTPTDSAGFPDHDCPNGFRAEVTYPSCWDGKNLDSSDHKSHMAYPTASFEGGSCPSSHPHHMVTLKVEFIFDTHKFAGWSTNPFVWSSGDPTGYGLHADYVMGWEDGLLDSAVEQCHDNFGVLANCPPFAGRLPPTDQTFANPGTCTVQDYVNEDVGGTLSKLPGCNGIDASKSDSSACDGGATLNGSWGDGIASVVSSLIGGSKPTGAAGSSAAAPSPSLGAPAGTGSGVAPPANVPESTSAPPEYGYSAPAGGYSSQGQDGYGSYSAPGAAASGHAFYEASASTGGPASPVAAVATPVAGAASPSLSPPSGSMGADGRRTLTVWDIKTETVYVTGDGPVATSKPEGWKREAHLHEHRHAHKRDGWW